MFQVLIRPSVESRFDDTVLASPSLVAYIDFAARKGFDLTGRGHDATYSGAPIAASGPFGAGVKFPTVNDFATVTHHADLSLGSLFSVAFWVRPDAGLNATRAVLEKGSGESDVAWLNTNKMCIDLAGVGTQATQSTADVVDGLWHFWTLTKTNATTYSMSRDGVAVAFSSSNRTPAGNTTNLAIGRLTGGTLPLQGALAKLAFWKGRAITLQEHRHLYAIGAGQ